MKNRSPLAKCRLCLEEKELCQSHIIPEWIYDEIYDKETGEFYALSNDPKRGNQILQKGVWEYLLCQSCETKLSKYEGYTKGLFHTDTTITCVNLSPDVLQYGGIDYRRYKYFLNSILWRLSITSGLLKGVSVGTLYEEKLRQMLDAEESGEPTDFPTVVGMVALNGKRMTGAIMQPWRAKNGNITVWNFVACGLLYQFYVTFKGRNPPPQDAMGMVLTREGTIQITMLDAKEDVPEVYRQMQLKVRAEKIRLAEGRGVRSRAERKKKPSG